MRLRDVPWDQALDVIAKSKGLGMQREGNLIRVAPQAVLEKELEAEVARQKAAVELQAGRDAAHPAQLRRRHADPAAHQRGDVAARHVSVDERTNS